jgi:hypothetical protein
MVSPIALFHATLACLLNCANPQRRDETVTGKETYCCLRRFCVVRRRQRIEKAIRARRAAANWWTWATGRSPLHGNQYTDARCAQAEVPRCHETALDGKSTMRTLRAVGDEYVPSAIEEAVAAFGAYDEQRSHVRNTHEDNRCYRERGKDGMNKNRS